MDLEETKVENFAYTNTKKQEDLLYCYCKQTFDQNREGAYIVHIANCRKFRENSLLPNYLKGLDLKRFNVDQLRMIKYEFKLILDEIENMIFSKTDWGDNDNITYTTKPEDDSIMKCSKCSKSINLQTQTEYLESCNHVFCESCIKQHIINALQDENETCCPVCNREIFDVEVKKIIGEELYEKLTIRKIIEKIKITSCVKCKYPFDLEPDKLSHSIKDDMGKLLDEEHELDFVQNRFKCSKCGVVQCRKCKEVPYHLGKTCEENQKLKEALLCKYCEQPVEYLANETPDVCNRPGCLDKLKYACKKILPCGHTCCGFAGEKECLPCLNIDCAKKVEHLLNGQEGNGYCVICGVETLASAPCIRSTCGHIFHLDCMTTRINKRWHRPRITFGFCICPLACGKWLEFPPESPLQVKMNEYLRLFENIKNKSMERLKYEKKDKDERLTTKGDQYYNKPAEYAMAIYSYYECFKCKKPYFGGLKKCEDMMQENEKNEDFKPQDLVCAECADVGITLQNCPKHGKEFIEFKCKFCCSIATWFCWGTTHFCERCHSRQCAGDYISKKPKSELPKCQGKKTCPLKVDHNGNGEEFALGCALCRNLGDAQDF